MNDWKMVYSQLNVATLIIRKSILHFYTLAYSQTTEVSISESNLSESLTSLTFSMSRTEVIDLQLPFSQTL